MFRGVGVGETAGGAGIVAGVGEIAGDACAVRDFQHCRGGEIRKTTGIRKSCRFVHVFMVQLRSWPWFRPFSRRLRESTVCREANGVSPATASYPRPGSVWRLSFFGTK